MAVNPYFPKLFEPGQIAKVKVKNRIVMSPVGAQFVGAAGEVTRQTIDHYVERAKGGVGLIITGFTCVDRPLGRLPISLALDDDGFLHGHYELVEAVHSYGAKIAVELNHPGRRMKLMTAGAPQAVAPSPIPEIFLGEHPLPVPRALEKDEIYTLMDKFAEAAARARRVGYDMVELHGAHGYLIASFMSPYFNKRTDEFGGSLENRMRFPLGIIKRIKEMVGDDYPLGFRISGDEFLEGGITVKDSPVIARMLENAGVAYIDISAGTGETSNKLTDIAAYPEGWKLYIWEAIKNAVSIPTIACGGNKTPAFCETLITQGKADFVGLARALLADPEWPRKAGEGRVEDIRLCIGCLECLYGSPGRASGSARCTVNAAWGREREFAEIRPASVKKRVMIIGGGPGGMEAARVASLRGHEVTLYEKEQELGGNVRRAATPMGKDKVLWLGDYLKTQINKQKVRVELGKEVTPEVVSRAKPDVVIVAAGSAPLLPNIPGINSNKVITAWAVLDWKVPVANQKVAVVGGGMVGCETAEFLADRGNKVTILEMLPSIASDMEPLNRKGLIDRLEEKNLTILTEKEVVEIAERGVLVIDKKGGDRELIETDTVVIAVGAKPLRTLVDALEGRAPELYAIGDCEEPRRFMDAIYEGSLIARRI